jgi:GIY-YIG catalytic domain
MTTALEFNTLLRNADIDPAEVQLMRHVPSEPSLKKILPWLAAQKPELYNAYQSVHSQRVEQFLLNPKIKYIASFIGHEPDKAVFIGLYSMNGTTPKSPAQVWQMPNYAELKFLGMNVFNEARSNVRLFKLVPTANHAELKGRLVIEWSAQRSWRQWASKNVFPIQAIHPDSILVEAKMPEWNELKLRWNELHILPAKWRAALEQWRGIYYIHDESDRMGYVGSAYGKDNLRHRWLNYSENGNGGNKLLKRRDPKNFSFSILQRVSPDMEAADIIQLENIWKEKLHTRRELNAN